MNAARIERALPYWLWPSDWWDALVASDPDRERLYAGARGVLSTALSAALLAAVARRTNQPIAVVLVGAMVGMMATMAVQDPDERSRRVTTLLLPLPAAAAVLLAAALPPGGVAGSAALLALTFAAVYVRRRGPRATALGMLAFLAYFNATFFGATLAQAPWMIASLVAGTAVTFVVRFALLPERPGGAARRALGAYRRSVALLLARLADAVRAGRPPPVASVRRAVRGVNDAAVRLETRLGADDRRPLDVELAAARVVSALRVPSRAALSPEARAEIAQALLDARRALRRPRATAPGAGLAPDARDASAAGGVAAFEKAAGGAAFEKAAGGAAFEKAAFEKAAGGAAFEKAAASEKAAGGAAFEKAAAFERAAGGGEFDRGPELAAALRALVGAELWGTTLGPAAAPPPPPPPPPAAPAGTLAPSTRQAIQATVACAIAMALGRLLSSERWQWAVMAAFVVFARVTTRGDTIARAWQRVLGTVAGVAVGAAIAHVAHGHPRVELGLVFALLFAALYLLRASQALMVLAISALLALLYDLMGRFSPGLLYLRVAETTAGAAAGAVVAALLLPERTTARVRAAGAGLLRAAAEYLLAAASDPPTPPAELGRAARGLDAKLRELNAAAEPLTRAPFEINPEASRLVRALGALVFAARQLAAAPAAPPPAAEAALAARVAVGRAAARASAVARLLEGDAGGPASEGGRAGATPLPEGLGPPPTRHVLAHLDETLAAAERAARGLSPAA